MQTDPLRNSAPMRMNRAKKAALLSGTLLPGSGQIYNGQKVKGIIIILLTFSFLGIFAYKIAAGFIAHFNNALMYSEIIIDNSPDTPISFGKTLLQGVLFGALPAIILWIGATIDAWRTGHAIDASLKSDS